MKHLMEEIERVLPDGGEWCDLTKAQTLASIVIAIRPQTIVEIGVWMGGSFVPMLLALKLLDERNRFGARAIAIDPWSAAASVAGESDENAVWWGETVGQDGHETAYRAFVTRLERHHLDSYVEIWRKRSDDCAPPRSIDLIHVDGNHTEQAVRDVERFLPAVRMGGIAVLDDVAWVGGNVSRAVGLARSIGFEDLYPLGTGLVMQRTARLGRPA